MSSEYLDITYNSEGLYGVGELGFASDQPILLRYPLTGIGSLGAVIINSKIAETSGFTGYGLIGGVAFDMHVGSSLVGWSRIGNLDFRQDESNEAGTTYMDWLGQVHWVMKLGNGLIIYGNGGITVMLPQGKYWSPKTLKRPGIMGKGAIAGDDNIHFFLTQTGELWSIDSQFNFKNLGFKRFFKHFPDTVVVSYDAERREVYLCDGTKGYKYQLDSNSLVETYPNITGIGYRYEEKLTVSPVILQASEHTFTTERFIPGESNGLKTLTVVGMDLNSGSNENVNVYVALQYRMSDSNTWRTSKFQRLNNHGQVFPNVTAEEFKIITKLGGVTENSPYILTDKVTVRNLEYTFQIPDKRFNRGYSLDNLRKRSSQNES